MSGDYSRWSFDPQRHFGAVLMQQGRVHTDADFNEWVVAALRRIQAGSLDTLGAAVVPSETPNGFEILATGGALTIGRGRMYVDGLLVENHGEPPQEFDPRLAELRGTAATPYDDQPYLPEPPPLPQTPGPHLVYLKAWQRERTAVEEPELIEPALGVDTTTRLQTAWQVKVLPDVGEGVTCATPLEDVSGFTAAEPRAAGRLTTGTADVAVEPDPCRVPPSGDYKGLENQLYRVEIHDAGDLAGADRATFKWSRDNGTVATRVTEIPALDRVVVESVGRDDVLGFSDGDWVEITDDRRELAGEPGVMRRIQAGGGVDDTTRTIRLTQALPAGEFPTDAQKRTDPERNTRVRRWDQHGKVVNASGTEIVDLDDGAATGTIPVAGGATKILLENGVVVTFGLEGAGGRFRTGDHWVFAARTADASVEELTQAPPRGIHAHYAKLALVTLPDAETDCRTKWPPESTEGCDCTVCVTPESHSSGALTIAAAVQQVKQSGGTVCLAAGEYPLTDAVEVHDARSVRIRGQGLATVLLATRGGEALDVRRSLAVTVENLSVVSSGGDAVRLERSLAATLRRCFVLGIGGDDRRSVAVRLAGYLAGVGIEECVLAADAGIAGGHPDEGDERGRAAITASLRITENWLFCGRRGIHLGPFGVHVADTRISGNTIWGCREAGIVAEGGATAGSFEICGNAVNVRGSGIRAGVDALRIADNDLHGGDGDGIALVHGLDPAGLDHCRVLANRITDFAGVGIALRTPVRSAMIKHNVLARIGGTGVDLGDDGAATVLVVENNQLLEVARNEAPQDDQTPYVAAMRFVAVAELDVVGNVIDGAAPRARLAAGAGGILVVAVASARIEGNRLVGIGPPQRSVGRIAGIEVALPFDAVTVVGNTLRRAGRGVTDLQSAEWIGLLVGEGLGQADERPAVVLGDLVAARAARGIAVLTATTAHIFARAREGDVCVRGNEVAAARTVQRPVLVQAATFCELSSNRLVATDQSARPSLVRAVRAIASANDLRGRGDAPVLELAVQDETPAVLGNLRTGPIEVNGAPLGDPWDPLNPMTAN